MSVRFSRSNVLGLNGAAASSQPLATGAAVDILKKGGNAADAAVAMAAVLNVTEPCSTGIGGDCFVLFYDAKKKSVRGILGNGRSPAGLSLELVEQRGFSADKPFDQFHPFSVTVPGAAAGWVDAVEEFGSGQLSLRDILDPAINLASNGFPVSEITAHFWGAAEKNLQSMPNGSQLLLPSGRAPQFGEIMRNENLAETFKELAEKGKKGFYTGRIAEAIVEALGSIGGVMTLDDLASHVSEFCNPISTNYRGVDIFEIPPPTQGIVALETLNILENFDMTNVPFHSAQHLHILIEALRLSFADAAVAVADPQKVDVPTESMLSKKYARSRYETISLSQASADAVSGVPLSGSDTVQFCCVDGEGNACSMINSNYMGFGSHIAPKGTGFTLQNRGSNFSLRPGLRNTIAGGKRPYHTIIPGMALKDGNLFAAFGVMGGFMQPQGHVQVLSNMIDFGFAPQLSLDLPRICIPAPTSDVPEEKGVVLCEEGISTQTISELQILGHNAKGPIIGFDRAVFGRGQIIRRNPESGVLMCGSDGRGDGCAIAY